MGVKISELVDKRDLKWEELQGKSLAIDASNVLFQFTSSIRQADGTLLMDSNGHVTSHLVGLFSRVPNLMQKGIVPVFVFDGEAPLLKEKTRAIRRGLKEKAQERYTKAVLEEGEEAAGRYSKQFSYVTGDMFDESKELLLAMGLPVVQAPSEAEAECAYMVQKKIVWASVSQDYDSLLFGAPRLIFNLTLSQKRKITGGKHVLIAPYLVELKGVLEKLQLTQDQLIVLGILVGGDYNPGGIKGIGPRKALKLLHTEKDFGKIFSSLETDFDWKEIFDTYKNIPVEDVVLRKGTLDEDAVKEILVDRHDFSEERVNQTLEKIKKVIPEEKSSLKKWF
ncbi:MAG: flap endonuclease-1 [archaeon GW2011_AR17]|nr:MAG: flap endonuclease-1 [archaeon GW2011_AR17]MBS3154269.1 flap endonuclease-1 [Candidatus Woesearchaeota archaeon]HIH14851.1 flap endonuclease-1 [Nanoarchaeota archaeon]HIH58890.1 flap endonuclease-1 [Nanoarchaeota archaeon]HII14020.1 flap endonuclease-1 [Nanoarchaeota archaeon]